MKHKQYRDDDQLHILEVEFIGGPYDGRKLPRFLPPAHLPADIVWLVCEDAFRLLDGEIRRPRGSVTSVALYQLEVGEGASRYRFAGATSPKALTESVHEVSLK